MTHICLGVVAPMKKEGLEPLVDGAQLVGLPIGIFKSGGFGDPWVGVQNSSREYKIGDGDPPIALFGREFTNLHIVALPPDFRSIRLTHRKREFYCVNKTLPVCHGRLETITC